MIRFDNAKVPLGVGGRSRRAESTPLATFAFVDPFQPLSRNVVGLQDINLEEARGRDLTRLTPRRRTNPTLVAFGEFPYEARM